MATLTRTLADEYRQLWDTCTIEADRRATVNGIVDRIAANRARYEAAGKPHGVPWFVVAIIHVLETGGDFKKHLHNGDPLTARTVHVPAGRPPTGTPPFTWEESAADAITMKLGGWTDWSVTGTLFLFERYNGFGYRPRAIHSPYLWSFSKHYTRGKFVKDGVFSPTAVSAQCGAAVLLRRLAERGLATLDGKPPARPILRYAPNRKTDEAEHLQRFLNTFPGITLSVDGELGEKSSDAFKSVTGRYLVGDPRARKK